MRARLPTLFDRLPKELLEVLKRLIIENTPDISRFCWENPTIFQAIDPDIRQ